MSLKAEIKLAMDALGDDLPDTAFFKSLNEQFGQKPGGVEVIFARDPAFFGAKPRVTCNRCGG